MGKFIDLTDKTFGRWKAIEKAYKSKDGKWFWKCKCDCGTIQNVNGKTLRDRTSNGCRKCMTCNYRHGLSRTSTYKIWGYMIARCHNPKDTSYKWYGARGISVCSEWREDFLNFFRDMGERPVDMTLERIDNNGNYCKDNCKWATVSEQNANRRRHS